ncbi:unnamed protein product [Leptidea sinapis]|uniref:Methyltransferase type 12 domain-containing protein n=1 Tax=Leptidea sinapis TaxID=189913 RepID=A0A5E4Q2R3_9NEOP|nr:unnamed protein product [Leptidea sinapis]
MTEKKDFSANFRSIDGYDGEKLVYPAASRNKGPILQVLKRLILNDEDTSTKNEKTLFLEIASGSGQHLAHFAPNFPNVIFQPSDVDETVLGSILFYADNCPTKNILLPKVIDIRNDLSDYGFTENSIDYLYVCNMIHISPFECTISLFKNAGKHLKPEALMIIYGPISRDGVITPQSNIDFDEKLRAGDPSWGIRDIGELVKLGENNNLHLIDTVEMPANNFTLIWRKV